MPVDKEHTILPRPTAFYGTGHKNQQPRDFSEEWDHKGNFTVFVHEEDPQFPRFSRAWRSERDLDYETCNQSSANKFLNYSKKFVKT